MSTKKLLGRADDERINWRRSMLFITMHLMAFLGACTIGWCWYHGISIKWELATCIVSYLGLIFCITGGYHRCFAHRSYKTSRAFQFILALVGTMAAQKDPCWWAAWHRKHHQHSDKPGDIHSPTRGIWWSHIGWLLCDKYDHTPWNMIKDLAKFAELKWLNRHYALPPFCRALACLFIGIILALLRDQSILLRSWTMVTIGFFVPTVFLYHVTYMVNSVTHLVGRRPHAEKTHDTSGNSLLIALITFGEGWHNDHHANPSAERQGDRWWKIDFSHYIITVLSWFGLVWDINPHRAQ